MEQFHCCFKWGFKFFPPLLLYLRGDLLDHPVFFKRQHRNVPGGGVKVYQLNQIFPPNRPGMFLSLCPQSKVGIGSFLDNVPTVRNWSLLPSAVILPRLRTGGFVFFFANQERVFMFVSMWRQRDDKPAIVVHEALLDVWSRRAAASLW